ncbi:DUF4870 domain-containing protein [Marinoscillum sp. MHG1-6]|uniref:DUF4870 domain-containing protein n=1 Tax=Marinoscillum sp. MHG1-6 TaxID=2959627 RepID=UPI0021575466|nr:DUF4870 domain-containing protein [Marinoscillum sp. MHG1-6]
MSTIMYHPVEQIDDLSLREREDAMGAYLMMFAALAAGLPLPIINLIAAIIYYFLNRAKSRFVKFHSLQSLLSQIPTTLLNAGLVFWTFRIIFKNGSFNDSDIFIEGFASVSEAYWGYLWVVVGANLLYVIFSIIGAIKARQGRYYYFLFFGKLAYHQAYKIENEGGQSTINEPPK